MISQRSIFLIAKMKRREQVIPTRTVVLLLSRLKYPKTEADEKTTRLLSDKEPAGHVARVLD